MLNTYLKFLAAVAGTIIVAWMIAFSLAYVAVMLNVLGIEFPDAPWNAR